LRNKSERLFLEETDGEAWGWEAVQGAGVTGTTSLSASNANGDIEEGSSEAKTEGVFDGWGVQKPCTNKLQGDCRLGGLNSEKNIERGRKTA